MSIQTITPVELQRLRESGQPVDLIDVRTPAEFAEVHVDGARLVPLDGLDAQQVMGGKARRQGPIYVICRSGSRADKACQKLRAGGFDQVVTVQGGTVAWEQAGLPVVRSEMKVISLERQVRIGAGALVLLGLVFGALVHSGFYALSGFVAAGLILAGVTDWCGMAMMLARMPWNRASGVACSP